MSDRRKNYLQRASSCLFCNLAFVDLLLLSAAPVRFHLERNFDIFDFAVGSANRLICKFYHSIKQFCMIFSILVITATACFRLRTIVAPRGRVFQFDRIAALIWLVSAIVTIPVIVYTDIVLVGPERSEMCRLTWIWESRERCEEILANETILCPENSETCGGNALLQVEKVYYTIYVHKHPANTLSNLFEFLYFCYEQ